MPGKRGSEANPIFFKSGAEYRAWLEKNHDSAKELWIGYWKKATGKPSLTWQDTVDESLCFGWIDGIRKSVDAHSFKQRVTPRRAKSRWSKVNVERVEALRKEGRMQPTGLAAYEKRTMAFYAFEHKDWKGLEPRYLALIKKNKRAWEFFQAQPPGYQKIAGRFVESAKQEETRLRRLEVIIRDSAAGRRIGLLTPPPKSKKH